MTVEEFFSKWEGKGLDFDGHYGFQCIDVYRQFVKEVLEVPQSPGVEGAKDVWTTYLTDRFTKITNSATNFPRLGDIVIWGTAVGQYGHIAICKSGDTNSFISFDQNWPSQLDSKGNGLGVCHFQGHNYNGVLGWLRPKVLPEPQPVVPTVNPDQIKVDLGEELGIMEIQAIRSLIKDLSRAIEDSRVKFVGLESQVMTLNKQRQEISTLLNCGDSHDLILREISQLIEIQDQANGVKPMPSLAISLLELFKKLFGRGGGK